MNRDKVKLIFSLHIHLTERGNEIRSIRCLQKKFLQDLSKRTDESKIAVFDEPRRHVVAPQECAIVSNPLVFYLVVLLITNNGFCR